MTNVLQENVTRLGYELNGLIYKSGALVKKTGNRLITEKGDEFVKDDHGYHLLHHPDRRMKVIANRSQAVMESKALLSTRESIRQRHFDARDRTVASPRTVSVIDLNRLSTREILREVESPPIAKRPLDFSGLGKLFKQERQRA